MEGIGFTVIRFSNDEVIGNTKEVIKKIKASLNEQANKITKANTSTGDSNTQTAISKATGGEAPLATAGGEGKGVRETSTMPGYAGSSWYFLRYMDPHNNNTFCDRKVSDYWNQEDVYVGGTEHAVGHLLYSRLWTKVLFDLGHIGYDEPYKRLVNQGMITGSSRFVYRITFDYNAKELLLSEDVDVGDIFSKRDIFISKNIYDEVKDDKRKVDKIFHEFGQRGINDYFIRKLEDIEPILSEIHVDVTIVDGEYLNIKEFVKRYRGDNAPVFVLENGQYFIPEEKTHGDLNSYVCGSAVEKMSKRYFNTVNPDELCNKFGADTFRMYEMFLGPVEASKPWDTKGIEGVHRFLKKLWRLFYDEMKGKFWKDEKASPEELKILHRAIKKIEEDTERFSFNTAVSTFMICVNDLNELKCHKKEVLEQLLVLLTPYAPHIAEELWHLLGNAGSVLDASYPVFDVKHVTESSKEYPVSINGKVRTNINIALDAAQPEVEQIVLANETVQRWLEGKPPKKIIYVKNKMVNVVV